MSQETIYFAMGCFWGVEKALKQLPGVHDTEVGYMGGHAPTPSYTQVCTGLTGHAETVRVQADTDAIDQLLQFFFENHDPTQVDGQGNDHGTQYRSVIFTTTEDAFKAAQKWREIAQDKLSAAGYGPVTTTIYGPSEVPEFWPAEEYHQDYLEKNPDGYCPVHATGIKCG
ncbi:peptide-methionine (S)-S-oxide reductase [Boudabousia liubingyangii]|uniref:Peptide methionine sulfoxide reductase MsrA n=1 Tax=Boudabousia liubingyangii TaxID=1921764 RepID=A0A1Q5PJT3_9ACTO|nr:peptide-methionine (S)-S-oxide reductase MsrA [Boudabousia liubingyangii]OKL46201.1 peptide-methionine (S)-S-oxide reductase [Boudabousia liubingyangii]